MPSFGSSDESIGVKVTTTADTSGVDKTSKSLSNLDKAGANTTSVMERLQSSFIPLAALTGTAGIALDRMTGFVGDSLSAASKLQAALTGLNSVARAFGQDANVAKQAAQDLAKDGLMTVADSATGLKNLLASGFNLDQAIVLMKRFKDSAAFGRQSALTFGQAVSSATEGIKNGNSILVDNAGVTKNLSKILQEAGFSANDLMNATSDANVRQALFNGILKETKPQLGDATRLTEQYAGKQAQLTAKTTTLKQEIGESLQPAMLKLLEAVTPMIEKFSKFTKDHPQLVAAVTLISTAVIGLTFLLGSLGLAVIGLGPIFTAMAAVSTGAISGVGLAMKGLTALVAAPMIMPALAVVAALASIALVANAVGSVRGALKAMDGEAKAAEGAAKSATAAAAKLNDAANQGKISLGQLQKTQSALGLDSTVYKQSGGYISGFASGTQSAPGGPAIVAEDGFEIVTGPKFGNLPAGSKVFNNTESKHMLQNTTSSNGVSLYQTNNIYNQVDIDMANRELGWRLANA